MIVIKKIYNNNIALVDSSGITKIATGAGIAFKKKIGDFIIEDQIEEQFILEKDIQINSYEDIFNNISPEIFEVINKAINYASQALEVDFNSRSKLAMIEHIYYAIKRYEEGNPIKNILLWELKRLYKREYMVAKKCIDIINKNLNVALSDDECGFITLHFINVTYSEAERNHAVIEAEVINDILNIIKNHYRKSLDRESEKINRLVTHIRYFVRKIASKEVTKSKNSYLYNYYRKMHEDAYSCTKKIESYVKEKLNFQMNDDELLYFIIHLVNLI